MNYLILANSGSSIQYAHLLIDEILRYDVRASIFINHNRSISEYSESGVDFSTDGRAIKLKILKEYSFDLIIIIGSAFSEKLVKRLRSVGRKVCFFQITLDYLEGYKTCLAATSCFDKVFVDIPFNLKSDKVHQIGSYQSDLIRKYDFSSSNADGLNIGILVRHGKNLSKLSKLKERLAKEIKDCRWHFYSDTNQKEFRISGLSGKRDELSSSKLNLFKNANAVIVDSEEDSITAALMNCPQISISGKQGLFGLLPSRKILVNEVIGKKTIVGLKHTQYDLIKTELTRILNDHEYCASMLTDYQEFKRKAWNKARYQNCCSDNCRMA